MTHLSQLAGSWKKARLPGLSVPLLVVMILTAVACDPTTGVPPGASTVPPPIAGGIGPPGDGSIPVIELVDEREWGTLVAQLAPVIAQRDDLEEGVYEHALAAYVLALTNLDTPESREELMGLDTAGQLDFLSEYRLTGAFEPIRGNAYAAAVGGTEDDG